jgi:CHAD domain-containing protein
MALDAKQVHKPVRKLRKLLKKVPKQPDPQRVHQLRTNGRRLEAMLSSLSLDSGSGGRRVLKGIAKIRKKAGGVRDMDVLISYVPPANDDREKDCRVQLLEHLGNQRRKEAKKLRAIISRKGSRTRAALKKVRRQLEKDLCEDRDPDCDPAEASSKAMASALALESELRLPTRLTRQNLHPYRLKVKELQYVLRLAENSHDQEFVAALGAVKDRIGEWHDWEELLAIAKEVLNHGANCKLMREIRNNCERKYEAALTEAQAMRKKYLGATYSKANGGLQYAAKPVWKATTAMAA